MIFPRLSHSLLSLFVISDKYDEFYVKSCTLFFNNILQYFCDI